MLPESRIDTPSDPNRRSLLTGLAAGMGGLAFGGILGRRTVQSELPGDATPTQQELRDNAFHGSFGMWPIIWSVPVATKSIALTFDDGPDPEFTPHVLDALQRHGARATFMMMGWNCVHHPDLVKRVVADGHEIGNHTWSHLDLATTDPATAELELRRGRDAIERISGQDVAFFRPPRGELSGVAALYAAQAQQSILMWTVDGGAHLERTTSQIHDHLVAAVKPGYIVDFHDGIGRGTFNRTATFARQLITQRTLEVASLPGILATLAGQGYRFVTVSELLAEPRTPSTP
jgi:peptidoglycan/xylan/chitin deacetylase (PgdA/CDA1 family)